MLELIIQALLRLVPVFRDMVRLRVSSLGIVFPSDQSYICKIVPITMPIVE
jgi:hypothetical protein